MISSCNWAAHFLFHGCMNTIHTSSFACRITIFFCTPNSDISILITSSNYEIVLTFMSHGSCLLWNLFTALSLEHSGAIAHCLSSDYTLSFSAFKQFICENSERWQLLANFTI